MPWPLSQDYNEALQNPQTSFHDPELRQGQAVVNALGIPQPCSGNFADVYAVECPATRGKWAIKCFTREIPGLRERYREISSYLQQIRLPFTVDFQYQEQGIRITGRWYPILKMHWVEGFPLNTFVRDMLDKPAMLEKLSRIWIRLARRLREADLAHCDLQHGNVLLVPASEATALAVKLIDYDGMWVPALANVPSGEVGHAAYQHPQRRRDCLYNAAIDRFPLLAIHVALRALIAGGRPLWERYDTGDNLLFRPADFEAPATSPLFAELLRLNHPDIRDLAAQLIDATRKPLEQTPHLADVVSSEKSAVLAAHQPAPVVEAAPAQPNPFEEMEPVERTRERPPSLIPWIAGGAVAACAVVGGVIVWGYKDIKPAAAQLAQAPNDPEANRIVGSFRCFEKGDWENGLPLLIRGDDAKLKALAAKDLAEPMSLNACIELGDGWWQLGKTSTGSKRGSVLQRACYWYERAVPEATEPTRMRLEKNIRSFNQRFPALAWGHLDIAQAEESLGVLRVSKGDKEILTRASWSGPVEITAVARTEKNNIRFRSGKGGCVIFNWENKPDELRITRPDGNDDPESGSLATAAVTPLRPNTWYFLSWHLTEDGMTVSVNGSVVFSEVYKNNLSEKHPISLHSVDSELEVLSFAVRPIHKKTR